jgi:predicted Ser/Thr protein kinase
MSTISELKRCPKCGGPIPAEAPQGLCPKCLLQQVCVHTEAGKNASAKSAPPTHEELAAAFPQLEILELIGQGGMGFVFKARQPRIERLVALKILPQSLATDQAFAERFTREGRVLARLNHPNIVTIHDFGQAAGFFYLLMEFVDGVNLRQAMKVGRFTPAQALAVVPKICEALEFAHHEGILHRDIKPENILLDSKGRVKIADFGIAKLAESADRPPEQPGTTGPAPAANLTETGKVLGTPQYMAPEQLEHPQDVDQRADIYSLGVVFYEMLTGELPIGRFAPPSEKSAVDARVDEVVLRTLEKERERRTQSAGEVKRQVETITATAATASSRPESQAEGRVATAATTLRRPRSLILVAALFIIIGCFAAWDIGSHFRGQSYRLNLGVLGLPIGIGLLRLRSRWRGAALLLPWVVFGIVAIVGVIALYGGAPIRVTGPSHIGYAIVGMFVGVMLFVWVTGVLIRADVSALFKPGTRGHPWVEWAAMVGAIAVSFILSLWTSPSADVEVNLATQSPAVSGVPSFGPVTERVLGDSETAGSPAFLNLETGQLYSSAELFGSKWSKFSLSASNTAAVLRSRGIDASARFDSQTPVVVVWECTPHGIGQSGWPASDEPDVKQPGWNNQSLADIFKQLPAPAIGGISILSGQPPETWLLKTRTGSQVVLEITGFTQNPRGVKIRYKLIQKADAQPGKTVVLTGATSELLNTGDTLAGMSQFRWSLPDSFSPEDTEAAITQLRQNKIARPITLVAGQSVELFSVTNKVGGIVRGLLRFERFVPGAPSGASAAGTNIQATVQLDSDNSEWLACYIESRAVPPGYRLELGEGDTSTSMSGSAGNGQPVVYGQPRQVFSFTSKAGEVYRGLFELVGPPVPANQ